MRLVPRSHRSVAALLILVGVAAVGHWLYWLLRPLTGWDVTDSANGAMVFLLSPTAIAGLLLLIGGAIITRLPTAGRVVATVGLGIALLYLLYGFLITAPSLGSCAEFKNVCGTAWAIIAVCAAGAVLATYCLAVLWQSRKAVAA